ncbi:MAG: hypothetical protein JW936_08275 [Sedimentisphaerales bacterium]|nr:hypothetical protein [Sedimentisphaerales bacterium]
MTPKELVKRVVHCDNAPRIAHYLPDDEPNDILWAWFGRPPAKKEWHRIENGHDQRIDDWGVVWERAEEASFGESVQQPITDITKQAEFEFPPRNDSQYHQEALQWIVENNASENPLYCLAVMPFSSLFEEVHKIMGLDKTFMAFYEHPKDLKALIARMAAAQRESIKLMAQYGCDGVMDYDDWGLQERLMISADMMEEFFIPHYRENWSLAHDLGMDVWMHSCGYIIEVLPMLREAGLNVIQMDQQENMGLENLDKAVGGKMAFWCPVDIQKTMVDGTIADIEQYVQRMIATIGNHRGGLISMAYSTPEAVKHTPEKIAAMCQAFRKYGVY